MMRVLVCEAGKAPELRDVASTLESWQAIVGGYVEEVPLGRSYYVYCNEDGISLRLPLNRVLQGHHLLGTFFVAKTAPGGNIIGLSDADVVRVLHLIGDRPS